MRIARVAIAASALALGLLAGVLGGWPGGGVTAASPAKKEHGPDVRVERGKKVYVQYCAHCHGAEGKGDGISGQNLPIRPQDLTEGRVLNQLPDHFLHRVVAHGAQSVGLSPLMPAFTPQLSETQVDDVVAFVRTLATPAYDPEKVLPVAEKPDGPVQPIFFSHVIHAGSYQINCQYCHTGARRGPAAGIPSVERCMGCHKVVAQQGNPEVDKLKGYWERKEPIPWVRVFKVPEHAHFVHKGHVLAGLPCQTCHGRIEAMERVTAGPTGTGQSVVNDLKNLAGMPASPNKLSMGWCVECHRAVNGGNIASLSWIEPPAPKLVRANLKAPLECVTCHH